MTLQPLQTCERCGDGEPVALVESDLLELVVCASCAVIALQLPNKGPGALEVVYLRN